MDIELLTFLCKNPKCDYIPLKTKEEKIKRAWRFGESIEKSARPRTFMKYVQGFKLFKHDGGLVIFECKYGSIILYSKEENYGLPNGFYNPIKDVEMCNSCIKKINNERRLFQ